MLIAEMAAMELCYFYGHSDDARENFFEPKPSLVYPFGVYFLIKEPKP